MKRLLLILFIIPFIGFGETETKIEYWDNGKVLSQIHYLDGKRDGSCRYWYEDVTLMTEGFYKNGKKHGTFTSYWSNGNISYIDNYKDGERHGEFKDFTSKGEIIESGNHNNGVECGYYFENDFIREYDLIYPQDEYHPDEDDPFFWDDKLGSNMWIEGNYNDQGRRQGVWKEYYENGTLMSFHNWKDDIRVGTCEHYDSDGVLTTKKIWENGEIIKRETY